MITWRQKVKVLRENGHHVVYHGSGSYTFYEYDQFKFNGNDKEDQALAREMINLDYDIIMLKAKEEKLSDRNN